MVVDYSEMPTQHVVVDGSNIATESRQLPSLAQLESALEELRKDFPEAEVTVVVDATFAHRIDPSELPRYEEASLHGVIVSPPAGAIGRGDAFLLRIEQKVDGSVLSNDSFQEFHGEHPWLFERGRLIGATPVPGVGWIFVPRTPVRGPRSRVATRDAGRAKARVSEAIAEATREVEDPEAATEEVPKARRSRARTPAQKPLAVNDPITFISFIADHRLGDEIEAEVESFTSHGAVVMYGEVRCYVPLANLADPPPRSAREVLHRGERERFVITALDPYRRGIELSLPGVAEVSGRPSEETVEAEVRLSRSRRGVRTGETAALAAAGAVSPTEQASLSTAAPTGRQPRGPKRAESPAPGVMGEVAGSPPAPADPTAAAPASRSRRSAAPRKAVPPGSPPAKTAPVKPAPAKSKAVKSAPVKSAPVKSVPVKSTAAKSTAVKSPPVKSAPVKSPAVKSPAVKSTAVTSVPVKSVPVKSGAVKSVSEGAVPRKRAAKKVTPKTATAEGATAPSAADGAPAKATPRRRASRSPVAEPPAR